MIDSKNVLILAPHTDDGEFGCGATIAKLKRSGANVTYVAFSSAMESVPSGFDPHVLKKEVFLATKTLGIDKEDVILCDFKVRFFPRDRQEILEKMVEINKKLKPDLVFMPSIDDTHQDHLTIAQEGFRAFKKSTILGYEVPWNNRKFPTTCFVKVTEQDLQLKIKSLECYESQKARSYANEAFIKSLALVRGTQAGNELSETFDVVRLML